MNTPNVTEQPEAVAAGSSPATGSADGLTFAAIKAAISNMPPKPRWCESVMNVESYERLRSDPVFEDVPMGGFGMMLIYCKPGQIAAAWMFSDRLTAQRYLEDELTENDLMAMVETGKCQPNDQAHP